MEKDPKGLSCIVMDKNETMSEIKLGAIIIISIYLVFKLIFWFIDKLDNE